MRNRDHSRRQKDMACLSPRAFYAAELRFRREQAGLTQAALARMLYITTAHLANLESGIRRIQPDLAAALDKVLRTDGFFVRQLGAGRAALSPAQLSDPARLAVQAQSIREWDTTFVPWLLQLGSYADAVARLQDPTLPSATGAAAPGSPLDADGSPRYAAVLTERALRRPIGNSAVMAEQLGHIATLARSGRIVLQVVPLNAEPHVAGDMAFTLMTFADEQPVVAASLRDGDQVVNDPASSALAELGYTLLSAAALPPAESLDLLDATAMDHGLAGA
jgi:transcriptional regulator with XRE-family HTH domain